MDKQASSILGFRPALTSISMAAAPLLFASGLAPRMASAHPMGNFAICHYARIESSRDLLKVRYVLDLAEIPTTTEKAAMDRDGNGIITVEEKGRYAARKTKELAAGLSLRFNGTV